MFLFPLLILLSSVFFWWVRKTFTFWNDKGIAHLTLLQYMHFCIDIYTKPLKEVVIRNYLRHGRIYGSYQGVVPTLVVGDADILRDILVTKFRNFSDRSIVIKINTVAEKMVSRIETAAIENKSLNFSELVDNASLDTTAALNYSVDLDSKNDKDHPLMKALSAIFMNMAGWKAVMLFLMPRIYKVLQPDYPPKANTDIFKAFVSHLIEDRKSKNKKEDDFLQLFMDADYEWENAEDKTQNDAIKRKMTLDEITAHGMQFFIGGVEGVAMAVTTTAYYLALHPHFQDRVIAEIDAALSEGGVTYEAMQQMAYLDACIKEALRLETPDSINMRLCTEETSVAGIRFEPGMCVDIPLAGIHHDAEYFPEPEKFNPERFLPENKESLRPFTYMAFGVGPRNCVGMRLGMLQAKTSLVCIFRRVRLETCPETMLPLKYKPCQLLHSPDGPVILRPILRCTSRKQLTDESV
ncbi:cytochrome P450 3A41-like isoform X2 [Dermacentor variabilis]|uniref:cytochrome P450 3A41-like isoform X2 n=1 Tax=Dermacentor variabilis TaxID=34621 RepID=UPI003F5C0FE0